MSYRSIKRVLGENSLERKCRILFGICMLLLIGGTFWGVMRMTEDFIREDARKQAKELLVTHLLKVHLASTPVNGEDDEKAELMAEITRRFTRINAKYDMISLDTKVQRNDIDSRLPVDDEELRRVRELVARYQRIQIKKHFEKPKPNSEEVLADAIRQSVLDFSDLDVEEVIDDSFLSSSNFPEDFIDRFSPEDRYQFYQPLIFTNNCMVCHTPTTYSEETEQWSNSVAQRVEGFEGTVHPAPPTYIICMTRSYREAKQGINKSRAILLAAAILTAFFSTAALYAIIRYVIVKPLKHLQGVIKEVAKGDMDVRSDLNTGCLLYTSPSPRDS